MGWMLFGVGYIDVDAALDRSLSARCVEMNITS
jgi:hypothetical protein